MDVTKDKNNMAEISQNTITEEMKLIEKEFEEQTAKEQEDQRKELEMQEENEIKEQRYKRLMHLLTCSRFYADFMIQKLKEPKKNLPKKRTAVKKEATLEKETNNKMGRRCSSRICRERNTVNLQSSSKDNPVTDLQSSSKENTDNKSSTTAKSSENITTKRKRVSYDIGDVIDFETINAIEKKPRIDGTAESSATQMNKEFKPKKKDEGKELELKTEGAEGTRQTDYGFTVSESQPLLFEGGVLREYQLEGLKWLKLLYENGVNGVLADEMGLGKTLQVIAILCHFIEMGVPGPFLVIAPLSTLPNWLLEFERFAPQVPVILFHGNEDVRYGLQSYVRKKHSLNGKSISPVVLTSFEVPLRDSFLSKLTWSYLVVDEGHRLKNHNCLLGRKIRQFKSLNRLLLTGTPLQNNLSELWSLLNFLLPEIFDDLASFEAWFDVSDLQQSGGNEKIIDQEKQKNILSIMHEILKPFLLRRVKSDIEELKIPPKKELIVYAPMSSVQMDLYRATVENNYNILLKKNNGKEQSLIIPDEADGSRAKRKSRGVPKNYAIDLADSGDEFNSDAQSSQREITITDSTDVNYKIRVRMFSPMMQLRKIVNHPYLVQFPLIPGTNEPKIDEELINKSGKLLLLDAMLAKLKQRNHKVLLFSTFTMVLDILEEYVLMREYEFVRLDGSTDVGDRQEIIKAFNSDSNIFIFLISTRAGGLGINLTAADTVIIFDSDWNPQVDLQAQDRCHRIGQTRPVVIYRFVTAGTIDEQIVERAAAKRKLEKMIIQKGKFSLKRKPQEDGINLKELIDLLNSSDQKVIQSSGNVFTDEELDTLLDRSDLLTDASNSEESEKKPDFNTNAKFCKVINRKSSEIL